MHFLKRLFVETCPTCQDVLQLRTDDCLSARSIKACPHGHYEKEYHPALESYIETYRS